MGKAGNGQHTKMCNQIAIAGTLAGACEAFVYAKNVGLDLKSCFGSISTGAAGSAQMNNVVSKALDDDYNPGFFLKHFIKDMSIANEEAEAGDVTLDILKQVLSMCRKLEEETRKRCKRMLDEVQETVKEEGMGDLGTQALIKHYKW